jgi:phage host-nuclease inhibitor protein Gam
MATTRKKKVLITNVSREDAERALADYAKVTARRKAIAADIELQCHQIREQYAAETERLETEANAAFAILEAFASENRDTLFQSRRSLDMLAGTIGYRTGMPQFKTDKGFTQAAVIQLIKDQYPQLVPVFIKYSEVLNKETIIAEWRRDPSDPARLDLTEFQRRCHAYVTQDEAFFVQPKEEEVQP